MKTSVPSMRINVLAALCIYFLCFFSVSTVKAQRAYIPDSTFRYVISLNWPGAIIGDSLVTNHPGVVSTTGFGILPTTQDITGIEYFISLESFGTSNTQVSVINNLPPSLRVLACDSTPLVSLTLPPALEELWCYETPLTTISSFPSTLQRIYCYNNQLTSLPALPAGLTHLICSHNQLTSLPAIPSSVVKLDCSHNNMVSLPSFSSQIITLLCDHNQLTTIPANAAYQVDCSNNLLTTIPYSVYDSLICDSNMITELPVLHPMLRILSCRYNNIHCMPYLPSDNLNELYTIGNPLVCLPNEPFDPTWTGFTDCIGILPVCGPANANDCYYGLVSGITYYDANNNCVEDAGDFRMHHQLIKLNSTDYAFSNDIGEYEIPSLFGTFTLDQKISDSLIWDIVCPAVPYTVSLDSVNDSIGHIDFPNKALVSCPILSVDIAASTLQRKCRIGSYLISYSNDGTVSVPAAFINVTFPSEIIVKSSSLPWTTISGNTYTFPLGTLPPFGHGTFTIIDSVDCNTLMGQTICAAAEIFPHDACNVSPLWDSSSVEVTGSCVNDTIQFIISNVGSGDMDSYRTITIYEDNVLFMSAFPFQLNAGEDTTILIYGTGHTYRLDAQQSAYHPGSSHPRSIVELCGGPAASTGFVTSVSPDDEDEFMEVACVPVLASYDPNDKSVQPSGIGLNHYITKDDVLEYCVRFQNTGNDTAFTVVVMDTLDVAHLDLNTFEPGLSSHPYSLVISSGVARWTFNNIYLTDTVTSEPLSHGWLKYKVKQKSTNTPGDVINNKAAIYFDFNDPIITNNTFLTIEDLHIVFGVNENMNSGFSLDVYPNPTGGTTNASVNVKTSGTYRFELFNSIGANVLSETIMISANGAVKDLNLPAAGVYFLKVTGENGSITKKIIKY